MTTCNRCGRSLSNPTSIRRGVGPICARKTRETIDSSYRDYSQEVDITNRQKKTISERRDNIINILEENLDIKESSLMGSFTRGTMTGPIDENSDADILLVLDSETHGDWAEQEKGPRNALNAIKRNILNKPQFSDTPVNIRRNVVQVKYSDVTVEVAPAFDYDQVPHADSPKGGLFGIFQDTSDGYAIPDTHGEQSWQGTNPRKYKKMFQATDRTHDGRLSDLTRTMKKWKDEEDLPVRSYHMEIMVYNYFEDKAKTGDNVPESYEELTQEFMDELSVRIKEPAKEPVYGESVDKGTSDKERKEVSKEAEKAKNKLDEAQELRKAGKEEEAKEKLKEVHGSGFN